MGQVPPKYFLPSSPYGASPAASALNPSQQAAQNPQAPLLPPSFQDPGTMPTSALPSQALQGSLPSSGGAVNPYRQRNQMFGRSLFGAIALLFLSSLASATTTVTGNIKNLGTTSPSSGLYVRFWLRGCQGAQPRVNGTALIAPSQGGVFFQDFVADANGNISGSVYSTRNTAGTGNGEIECPAGVFTASWYGVQLFAAGRGGPETPVHAKIGAVLNVTNATPLTSNPVVIAPTGDTTYLRLDGGNSPVTGNVQLLAATSAKNLQNVRYVSPTNIEGWPGSNAGAWANAAATDLGGAGQVIFRSGTYSIPTANPIIFPADGVSYSCASYRNCFINGSSWVAGDFAFLLTVNHTNVGVSGFVIQCAPSTPSIDIRGITNNNNIVWTRALFADNEIFNCFDGIDFSFNALENVARNNYIHNIGQQAMTVQGNRNQILNNRVDTVGTTSLHHGIYLGAGDGNEIIGNVYSNIFGFCITNFSSTTSTSITNTRIIGNHCDTGGLASSGSHGGIFVGETAPTTGNRQGTIQGNTIINCNPNGGGAEIQLSAVTDTAVIGNTMRSFQGEGILIQGSTGFNTTRVNVIGNVIQGGSVSGNGIRVIPNSGTVSNIVVYGNIVDTVFGTGIWMNACTDCQVTNNRSKDWNLQGGSSNAGILIDSASIRNQVTNNNVSTVNTTNSPNGIYITASGPNTDNIVTANIINSIGGGNLIADLGTRDRVFGNITDATDAAFKNGGFLATTGGISDTFEGTAPAGLAGNDRCYGDSTAHAIKCSYNNGSFFNLPLVGTANTWTALQTMNAGQLTAGNAFNFDAVYGTYRVTTDQTITAGAGLANIPGLSWTMPANTALNVAFHCEGSYNETTAATSMQFGIQDVTVAPTNIYTKKVAWTSISAASSDNTPTLATTTATGIGAAFTPSAATTVFNFTLDGMIEQPSNASTSVINIMAQFTTNNGVIKRGSYCRVW